MRYSIFIFFFLALSLKLNAQKLLDDKYLIAIIYLRTNEAANEQMKQTFQKLARKKSRYVDFNIHDQITFLEIWPFQSQLLEQGLGIDKGLVSNENLYRSKYRFKPYTNELLASLMKKPESKLFLTFSKPVDDFLLAEMTTFYPNIKMGKAMQFLFKFNSNGLIEKVLYSTLQYN